MPTTLYTKQQIHTVSYDGQQFKVVGGKVEVPDEAVTTLCESHGFTTDAPGTGNHMVDPKPDKQVLEMPTDKPANKGGRPARKKPEESDDE
jgi:hypothetical protein